MIRNMCRTDWHTSGAQGLDDKEVGNIDQQGHGPSGRRRCGWDTTKLGQGHVEWKTIGLLVVRSSTGKALKRSMDMKPLSVRGHTVRSAMELSEMRKTQEADGGGTQLGDGI